MDVVIVDDNLTNTTLLKHLVRRLEDCTPYPFTVSAEALEWCFSNSPDLVLVDYMMPAPDGMEFIERLRATSGGKDIPVLMVTADHEVSVRYKALELGANDFLTKPVDRIEFLARTRNMLALRRSQKQLADRADWLATEVKKATGEIRAREHELILRLSKAAEYRDPETGAHLLRMAHYSETIAKGLGLSEAEQQTVLYAAPMHDIGKVGIRDHILLKPERLDEREFAIMRGHPRIGYEILQGSTSPLLQIAASIALTHHERWDGTGYPQCLKGEDIPLHGRIVAVADVFDALTSNRPYKRAWPIDEALDFLRQQSGSHFDPKCVQAFLNNTKEILAIRERYLDEDNLALAAGGA